MNRCALLVCAVFFPALLSAAEPEAAISNGQVQAKVYLPEQKTGFYQGTRFDWSGVIGSLTYKGHNFFGPWFTERRAGVRDFIYEGDKIVTGTASSITGPVEEYAPLAYDEAAAGGTFIKLGIGALKKPDTAAYDHYKDYEFVDPGKWTVKRGKDFVEFQHVLNAPNGYAYVYTKRVQLTAGKPQLVLSHSLKNTGKNAIKTSGYNHNFLTLDGKAPGPGYTISMPFEVKNPKPFESALASLSGKQLAYQKALQGQDRVSTPLGGHSSSASDYDFRLESKEAGAGMRITGDKPMSRATLWSIRSVVAVEPFIDINLEPGQAMDWKYTYDFYTLGK